MKGRFVQVVALAIAIVSVSSCKRSDDENKSDQKLVNHIERAETYRKQGQYRAAIIEARNAIDAAPHDTRGAIELATLFNELNQGKQALHVLEPIASSNDHAVIIAQADALLAQGKFRSALDYLQKHRSDDAEIHLRIAKAQAGLGQLAEAESSLIALENSTQSTPAKLQLARIYLQQNKLDATDQMLRQILQSDADNIEALTISAKLSEIRGDLENAEALLSRALIHLPQTDILTPQKASVLQELMPILTKLGRVNESLVYAKVLADADPQSAVLQDKFKQAVEAFKTGKLDDAERLLDEVYGQTHDDYAGILLGMVKYGKKDYAGAANYLGENVDPEIAPDAALKALANAEMRLGQPTKLLEIIDPDERKHIKDPELKALVGIALVQSGSRTDGEKMLIDALNSDANNSALRATLARHYLASKQTAKAITVLEEGLAQKADNGLQRLLIGAYIVAGKPDAALQTAQKLAATKPEQAVNYYVLGHTALITQQYTNSENALQKALTLQSDYAPALLDLAQLHLIQHQSQAATAIYQRLIAANADNETAIKGFITAQEIEGVKADTNDVENRVLQLANTDTARAVVAEYYLRNQRREDANRLLATINITPGNSYAVSVKQLYALAEASELLKAKEFNRASQTVLEGLRLNPRNSNLLALLARIQIAAGAKSEAGKIIEQLAQLEPDSPMLIDLRAALAQASGDTASAIQQLRDLWNTTKNDQTANRYYQALAKTDPAAATQFLTEWQTSLPNSDSPWLLRAVQYEHDGDMQQAQKYYEAALKRNDNNPWTLNNLAMLYFSKGDNRALALAEKAYTLQSKNPVLLDTYGWILVNTKDREKGIALLKQAAAINPTSTEIAEHLKLANQIKD